MISNTDSTLLIYSTEHMRVKVYNGPGGPGNGFSRRAGMHRPMRFWRVRFRGCRGGWVERHRDTPHLLSAARCRHAASSDERAEEDARRGARVRLTWPPRPPDPRQAAGETAPQTAPPFSEAQTTAGAIANGASR